MKLNWKMIAVGFVLVSACGDDAEEAPSEGEKCGASIPLCGDDLRCIDGICTAQCTSDKDCTGGTCVKLTGLSDPTAVLQICDKGTAPDAGK